MADYIDIMIAFYHRLRARAYPASFLRPLFLAAPDFSRRDALLSATSSPATQAIPFVMKLTFSDDVLQLGLQQALLDTRGSLPAYLRQTRRLVVWKRAPRLGDTLKKRPRLSNDFDYESSTSPPRPAPEVT